MKNKALFILFGFVTVSCFSQSLAFTENGTKIFLSENGTYQFLKILSSINKKKNLKGMVKGKVSFYDDQKDGVKPDIGSKILIRKTNNNDSRNFIISEYNKAKYYKKLIKSNAITDDKYKSIEGKLEELDANSDNGFDELCSNAIKHVLKSRRYGTSSILTVDKNGDFEAYLDQGTYEVIAISKNKTFLTEAEVLGQITNKIVEIKNEDVVIVNFEFNQF